MINQKKIDEWLHEVEERPSSAAVIIQYIANRLRELTERNEELLADNIALRSGLKVEEYESRIANLEYQLEMLKRQIGGDIDLILTGSADSISTIAFLADGKVFRYETLFRDLQSGGMLAKLPEGKFNDYFHPRLIITNKLEELLFIFDSGRTVTMSVADLPISMPESSSWETAHLVEPRGGEELVAVLSIARMSLYDFCIQVSRRGYVKRMMRTSFESHLAKNFIGTGVKQKPDRTAGLGLCMKDEVFVLVSREGWLVSHPVGEMSFTAEETIKLSATDHIVCGFSMAKKDSMAVITRNGKVIIRDVGWLEKPSSSKSRGQAIFSQTRRVAGIRVVGAAAVNDQDWGAVLSDDGAVTAYRMKELAASGALNDNSEQKLYTEFVLFHTAVPEQI